MSKADRRDHERHEGETTKDWKEGAMKYTKYTKYTNEVLRSTKGYHVCLGWHGQAASSRFAHGETAKNTKEESSATAGIWNSGTQDRRFFRVLPTENLDAPGSLV